jgi:hypothetical protein
MNCTVTVLGVLLKAVVSCHVPSVTFVDLGFTQQSGHAEPSDQLAPGWYTGCAPVFSSPFSSSMVIFRAPAWTSRTRLSIRKRRKRSVGIATGPLPRKDGSRQGMGGGSAQGTTTWERLKMREHEVLRHRKRGRGELVGLYLRALRSRQRESRRVHRRICDTWRCTMWLYMLSLFLYTDVEDRGGSAGCASCRRPPFLPVGRAQRLAKLKSRMGRSVISPHPCRSNVTATYVEIPTSCDARSLDCPRSFHRCMCEAGTQREHRAAVCRIESAKDLYMGAGSGSGSYGEGCCGESSYGEVGGRGPGSMA